MRVLYSNRDGLKALVQKYQADRAVLIRRMEQTNEVITKNQNDHDRITGGETFVSVYQRMTDELRKARQNEEKEIGITAQLHSEMARINGHNDFYVQSMKQQDELLRNERSLLDTFISNYNVRNAPIQYVDLEILFADGKDWNTIREKINNTNLQKELTRTHIDELNSRLDSLQAESGHTDIHKEGLQAELANQYQTLIAEQQAVLEEIARIDVILADNGKIH